MTGARHLSVVPAPKPVVRMPAPADACADHPAYTPDNCPVCGTAANLGRWPL